MSAFGGLIFTNKGRNLQAKAQTGVQLNFTRIAVGDGELGGSSIADINTLKHEIKSISITKLKILPGGKAVVGGSFSNQDLPEGFFWRELGVFAQDPDLGEILYCYGNAGSNAEYIPAGGGPDVVEKLVDVVTLIGNASDITATIDQSLIYATMQDLNALALEVEGKETPAGAQEKATTALEAANTYTDQEVGAVSQALNSHKEDNVKHITSAERNNWNSKAAGNHNHSGVYEPANSNIMKKNEVQAMNAELNMQDNLLTRPYIKDYAECLSANAAASGTVTLNIETANNFNLTIAGATTLAFSNPSASGRVCSITVRINMPTTLYAITFPASVKWAGDKIPIFTAGKTAYLTFVTFDGGSRWHGFDGGTDFTT